MKYRICVLLSITLLSINAEAQKASVKLFAELPVQFGLGYEGRINERFSVAVQSGILTKPNSTIILNVMESLGTDREVIVMIQDAFQYGWVGEIGLNYNVDRNYFGVYLQRIDLRAKDTPASIIENYGVDLGGYPTRDPEMRRVLHLKSVLYQAGLLVGRRVILPNDRFAFNFEFAVSANLASQTSMKSDSRTIKRFSDDLDEELDSYYSKYAFVPSINVGFVYRIRR